MRDCAMSCHVAVCCMLYAVCCLVSVVCWLQPAGRETVLTAGPAGSVYITDYPILHRRAASTVSCTRNALKFNYWRTAAPARDWAGAIG